MNTNETVKLLAQTVVALQLRVKALEVANRAKPGATEVKIVMDEETRKVYDRLNALLAGDIAPATDEDKPAKTEAAKIKASVKKEEQKIVREKQEANNSAPPRRKLSDLTYVELQKRVEKRGGNLARILKGVVGGPARKKVLVKWLIANKPAK